MIARDLLRHTGGSSAAEFAMVLPLLLILLFGIIDGGRFMWEYNRAEKAAQMGARFAVVTDPVAGGITTTDFTGVGGLTVGSPIPASALPDVTCNNSTCTCTSCPSGIPGTYSATAFNNIVARMQEFDPQITAANVQVVYRGSGLGYAGDPTGPNVSPLVTVQVTGLQFQPLTAFMLATVSLPSFTTTLTAEDLSGSQSG